MVVRDLERGLIDFPSLLGGEEIYLCWLLDEPDGRATGTRLESGFGGRRPAVAHRRHGRHDAAARARASPPRCRRSSGSPARPRSCAAAGRATATRSRSASRGRTRRWCSSPTPRRSGASSPPTPDELHGGASSTVLEPFAGPDLDPAHARARAPAPAAAAAARLPRRRARGLARDDRGAGRPPRSTGWRAGEPLRTLPRMQALTLDVILRVVLGPRRAAGAARRDPPRARHDGLAAAAGRDVAAPRRRRGTRSCAPSPTSTRCCAREIDRGGARRGLAARRPAARAGTVPRRRAARPGRHRARRRPRDDGRLARLGARAARAPPATCWRACATATTPTSTRRSRRCCACGPCSRSPPARSPRRSRSAATRSRRACTSRRASTSPTAARRRGRTRPRSGPSASSTARRRRTPTSRSAAACAAAPARAFATLELREVLRAVLARFALRPGRAARRAHAPRLRDACARRAVGSSCPSRYNHARPCRSSAATTA